MLHNFKIVVAANAKGDIKDIYNYVRLNDSESSAKHVLDEIEKLIFSLEVMPMRGHVPYELLRVNLSNYLELHFKPYRVIYEIEGDIVFVHCVLDGRRELSELLQRRLLR